MQRTIKIVGVLFILTLGIIRGSSQVTCPNSYISAKKYFDLEESLDPIEGIWDDSYTEMHNINPSKNTHQYQNYRQVAILKKNDYEYLVCEIKPSIRKDKEVKYRETIEKTAAQGVFTMTGETYKPFKEHTSSNMIFNGFNLLEFEYFVGKRTLHHAYRKHNRNPPSDLKILMSHQWLKKYPINNKNNTDQESYKIKEGDFIGHGSGFSLDSDGHIATNYHVIKDAGSLKVRGLNGDFNTSYNLKVISKDIRNDLAILKIEDDRFVDFKDEIEYGIKFKKEKVGKSIFIYGYPLISTMGEEIKLTTGIISSNSGYGGDITTYQTDAAAQSGNSGGPVFNEDGYLIGILSSKHTEADNATYVIKSQYLLNLLNDSDDEIDYKLGGKLEGVELSEQVESVKDFIYIIESYK